MCLPWQLRGIRAIERFNEVGARPAYEEAAPPWSAEAREAIERLPAFARNGNFLSVTEAARPDG